MALIDVPENIPFRLFQIFFWRTLHTMLNNIVFLQNSLLVQKYSFIPDKQCYPWWFIIDSAIKLGTIFFCLLVFGRLFYRLLVTKCLNMLFKLVLCCLFVFFSQNTGSSLELDPFFMLGPFIDQYCLRDKNIPVTIPLTRTGLKNKWKSSQCSKKTMKNLETLYDLLHN